MPTEHKKFIHSLMCTSTECLPHPGHCWKHRIYKVQQNIVGRDRCMCKYKETQRTMFSEIFNSLTKVYGGISLEKEAELDHQEACLLG